MRYFESKTPLVRLMAVGGVLIEWSTYDGEVGWYVSDNPNAFKTLDDCIARKVGGIIREGTQAEYEAFLGKVRGLPVFRRERETVGPEGVIPGTFGRPAPPQPSTEPEGVAVVEAPTTVAATPPEPTVKARRGRGTAPPA